MAKFIARFLKIPTYRDNESNVVARLTQGSAIGLALFSLIFVIAVSFVAPGLVRRATALAVTFTITSLGVIALIRTQRLQFASFLLVVVMWLAVTIGSITAGGISAPIFIGYLVVVLAGGLISSNRINMVVSAGCILGSIIIALAEVYGLLPDPIEYSSPARFGIYFFLFAVTILLQTVSRRNMQGLLKQAKDSEDNYKSLLENIPTITYINSIDIQAHTQYVSPQVKKLLGYSHDEFLQDPELWKKILHPEDSERVMASMQEGTNTGQPFNLEYRLITHDQRVVWVRDEATLVRDDQGKPLYWLGI